MHSPLMNFFLAGGGTMKFEIPWPLLLLAIFFTALAAIAAIMSRQWMMRNVFGLALASGLIVRIPTVKLFAQSFLRVEIIPEAPSSWLLALLAILHLIVLLTWKASDESKLEKTLWFLAKYGGRLGIGVAAIIGFLILSSFFPAVTFSTGTLSATPPAGYGLWEVFIAASALGAWMIMGLYAITKKRARSGKSFDVDRALR